MTRDDIIRMAQQCWPSGPKDIWAADMHLPRLERFAALVAATEREACCSIVHGQCESDNVAQRTVDAIRARVNN